MNISMCIPENDPVSLEENAHGPVGAVPSPRRQAVDAVTTGLLEPLSVSSVIPSGGTSEVTGVATVATEARSRPSEELGVIEFVPLYPTATGRGLLGSCPETTMTSAMTPTPVRPPRT